MFHCLPDSSKCESRNLKPFIEHFNRKFNQEYRWAECIDVFDSSRPQPEMRFNADGRKDIVIEHKIIVWPEDHLQRHSAQHDFAIKFEKIVGSSFQDDTYMLGISPENIPINKKKHSALVKRLAHTVLQNTITIKEKGIYKELHPFPWSFYRLPVYERDEDTPNQGVGVNFSSFPFPLSSYRLPNFKKIFKNTKNSSKNIVPGSSDHFLDWLSEPDSFLEDITSDQLNKIKDKFISHLKKTSEKFEGYSNCIRIFITAVYSKNNLLDHEVLEQILPSEIPNNIDQIWSSYPEWISDTEQEILYELVYENKK